VTAVGASGCAFAILGIVSRRAFVVALGIAFVGSAYAVFLRLRGGAVDTRAVYVAAALYVATELAFVAIGPARVGAERAVWLRTLAGIAAAACSVLVAGEVILTASGSANAGLVVEAVGAAAAVAAVGVVLRIAGRLRDST
jgi:predicted phage tail protein